MQEAGGWVGAYRRCVLDPEMKRGRFRGLALPVTEAAGLVPCSVRARKLAGQGGFVGTQARRVNLYVDGFNLYYGCCKATPYKWLDLAALAGQLLPGADIRAIRYFTADVNPDPSDPDQQVRQHTYLRAVRTIPNLSIKKGFFLTKPSKKKRVYPLYAPNPKIPNPANHPISVWKVEEKGSDVNLATSMLLDAAAGTFDDAWVVTNDSDLAWPIQMARKTYRVRIGVFKPERPAGYNPSRLDRPDSWHLIQAARWFRRIEEAHLAASQFPTTLSDGDGVFSKPVTWA